MNESPSQPVETLQRGDGTRDWMIHQDSCKSLRQRGIVAAGYTQLGPGYELLRPRPLFANVVVCCEGSLEYFIDAGWRASSAGAVMVAPHGVPHGVRTRNGHALTAWIAFEVSRAFSGRRGWDTQQTRLAAVKDHRPLWWALQGLYTESTGRNDLAALGHWADLALTAATRLADDESQDPAADLRPVWERVDAELGHPWSATSIAELASFSPSHFRRLCRERMGRSPAQHLAHLRMQRAAMLLTTTEQKLTAIAAAVGYENVFAFSVAFKRWSGRPPTAYQSGR